MTVVERFIACSRRSDRGDSAKISEQKKKTTRGWGGSESEGFFSRSLSSRRTPLSERLEQAKRLKERSMNGLSTKKVAVVERCPLGLTVS